MRPWTVTLESLVMVLLWLINAIADMITCIILMIFHDHGGFIMMGVLGTWHFLLNAWIIRFQWRNINRCGLLMLFLTQTAPWFMLCRKAWRSLVPCCAKDDRTKKRKALIAKYSLCCKSWSSTQKEVNADQTTFSQGSCIPSELIPDSNSISASISISNACHEDNDGMLDQILSLDNHTSKTEVPMGTTKFVEDTYDIELNFNSPQEIYIGEPNLINFLMKRLQMLFVDEKKLSYHIVTDSKNMILYVTKSDRHIRKLPVRMVNRSPTFICNDIHYALNLTKGNGYEVFAVTKRTVEETTFFVETDLSRIIWALVWPSAIIKLYTILDVMEKNPAYFSMFMFLSPLISIITWLATQRGVSEPWINTAILIPLRITITVTRTLLVVGIALTSMITAAFCYITAKASGVIILTAYLTYMKKYRNIELYSDEIDKYTFYPMYQPVIQVWESIVYLSWAIWWYSVTPLSEFGRMSKIHLPLIVFLTTLLGHVFGLVWLWFGRSYLKKPLRDPRSVLQYIQSLEYIKT